MKGQSLLISSLISSSRLQDGWLETVYPGLSNTKDDLQQLSVGGRGKAGGAVQGHSGNQAGAEDREACGLWKPGFEGPG